MKAIDTGVVSKKRHPLSQEFGDIPSALLKEDSPNAPVAKPATTTKGKHKKSAQAVATSLVATKDGKGEKNDKAMQDAVIAKIMASIKEQMAKNNEASGSTECASPQTSVSSPGAMSVAKTLLQSTGPVHTVASLTSTDNSGVNCSPGTQLERRLIMTRVSAAPPGGGVKNSDVVSLLQPTVVPPCSIVSAAQLNSVQSVIANPTQFITTSSGQLHLIGNQLVCLAPAPTVAVSSQQTENLSGVAGASVQHQFMSQQAAVSQHAVVSPPAMAAVAMTTSSTPFLSSVSSSESGHASATDLVTDSVDLSEVVIGDDENTGALPMPLDDVLTNDDYDDPMYSETLPSGMESMNATALEHAYFSSRTEDTASEIPSETTITSDNEGTKKVGGIFFCDFVASLENNQGSGNLLNHRVDRNRINNILRFYYIYLKLQKHSG